MKAVLNNTNAQSQATDMTPKERFLNLRMQNFEKNPYLQGQLKHVEEMIPTMPWDVDLLLKKIYTKNYWEPIGIWERSCLGEYIACLVAAKRLPLRLVGRKNNSNLYRRI